MVFEPARRPPLPPPPLLKELRRRGGVSARGVDAGGPERRPGPPHLIKALPQAAPDPARRRCPPLKPFREAGIAAAPGLGWRPSGLRPNLNFGPRRGCESQ